MDPPRRPGPAKRHGAHHGGDGRGKRRRDNEPQGERTDGKTCLICMGLLRQYCTGSLVCEHEFCYRCIKPWVEVPPRTCPTCRRAGNKYIWLTLSPQQAKEEKKFNQQNAGRKAMKGRTKGQKKTAKHRAARLQQQGTNVFTKKIRIRSKPSAQATEQDNEPHPQAPGGAMYAEEQQALAAAQIAHADDELSPNEVAAIVLDQAAARLPSPVHPALAGLEAASTDVVEAADAELSHDTNVPDISEDESSEDEGLVRDDEVPDISEDESSEDEG